MGPAEVGGEVVYIGGDEKNGKTLVGVHMEQPGLIWHAVKMSKKPA